MNETLVQSPIDSGNGKSIGAKLDCLNKNKYIKIIKNIYFFISATYSS